jgi:paraquat-inducible protein B
MTENDAHCPEASDGAETPVVSRRRSFSLVWLVPIAAALIGGWLVVKALTEKGPEITITFQSAEGLEAGKTKIKYKDVEIGQVQAITLGPDLRHVVVKAQLVKDAERLVGENTRFWVVRARVSASAIYGLGTVFSGAYIDLDPGQPGKPARSFTGLEEPPVVTTGLPGRHFVLESPRRGSIEVGTPLYYRQIKAGEVVAYALSEDGTRIVTKVFVYAPYHRFVTDRSRFWIASGLDVKLNAQGIQVDTESIVSILVGGIAFDTVEERSDGPGAPAEENAHFRLFASREAAMEKIYSARNYYILLFEESVRGLLPGAPVEFRGLPIGQVIDIKSEFDFSRNKVTIPVVVAIEPERIAMAGKLPAGVARENLADYLVERGLRAQMRTGNILTGQNYVALDFFPNAKPAAVVRKSRHEYPEFPTTPTQFEEIGSKLTQLVAKLEKIPIEQIGQDIGATLKGANRVVNSPEILETVKSLNAAVQELRLLTTELRTRTAPEAAAALKQTQETLASAAEALEAGSPLQSRLKETLEELAAAARALRVLADSLERQPQSILTGKEPTR